MADDLNREFPLDTFVQNYWLPSIRAAVALQRNNPEEAVHLLRATFPYDLAMFYNTLPTLQPMYLRGEAYLKWGHAAQAREEFQKVLDHPWIGINFVTSALAHLQLGRAQVMMGDKAAARKSYNDFLTLWKDADPDIPIYKQAKAEYAKLQ
jgi:tetratricopeptide (TPR) repeat protein